MKPLESITVVALEHAIAAPFCTRQLADHGARVIKVERPGAGDFARSYDTRVRGLSSHFVWTNRGKESLTLDLKHAEAPAVLGALLARADVLVQNLAPGAAARMGLSFDDLHPRHPKLVVCDISGYGDDPDRPGPYRDRKAYDLLIQSESGFLSITGTADEPAKAGCSIADIAAGMYAYSSILAALIERGRTGRGRRIDISMLESMAEWMGYPLYYAFDGAAPPPRSGAAHATIYPYGPFPAGDGGVVMLGLQNEREWQLFCERVLGQPALAVDPRFASNAARTMERAALRAIVVAAFAGLDTAQVLARLDHAQIANARVNTMAEVWSHAQLQARGRWAEVQTPAGPVPALLPPGVADASEACMGAVPALGQHTDALLAELGLDAAAIARLRVQQAV
ncbi:MAG TPA: CaiB/BaiF CoA-transferase family protein [Caldimonas sp.]|nr:CaiB/BaiF CoA-transferase family protein [Caldimonas sp.]HEX2539468.1 CaiB/BaiF CoA-transferase family protein [Caldimonas sp.]